MPPVPPPQWRPPVAQQWTPQWQTPYGQAQPQPVPPPKPPAPPKRRTLATAVWCMALAVTLLVAGSHAPTSASEQTSTAVSLIGPNGLSVRYAQRDGVASATWSRTRGGATLASSGPDALGWWPILTKLDQASADLARFSATWAQGAATGHSDEVFSLVNGDVRREVAVVGSDAQMYRDGRLELPATIAAGSTWTSQGSLYTLRDGKLSTAAAYYTSDGSAETAQDAGLAAAGCLDVVVRETIQGAPLTSTTRTWCPGRGIVRFGDGATTWQQATSVPESTVSPVSKAFDWTRAADLSFAASMPLTSLGSSLLMLTYVSRPGVLPDGTLVVALKGNGDIVALDTAATTGNKDHTTWRVHPGGVITSCVTLGEITVATTSERKAVAYGPTGLALWSAPLTDTSNARPAEFGGRIVVVTVDGGVVALDQATGAEAWRSSLPNEIQLRPQVSGDTLVAIDESGTMVAFDTSGNQLWRTSEPSTDMYTISSGVVVLHERGGSAVRGYDLATGTKLWRVWQPTSLTALVDVDGVAVAYGLGGVTSYDAATGAVGWTETNAPIDAMVEGDHLVLLTTTDLVVLGRDGKVSAQWRHDLTNFSTTTAYLVIGPDSVSAVTTTQLYRGVLP